MFSRYATTDIERFSRWQFRGKYATARRLRARSRIIKRKASR